MIAVLVTLTTTVAFGGRVGCYSESVVGEMEAILKEKQPLDAESVKRIRTLADGLATALKGNYQRVKKEEGEDVRFLDGLLPVEYIQKIIKLAETIANDNIVDTELPAYVARMRTIVRTMLASASDTAFPPKGGRKCVDGLCQPLRQIEEHR